MGDGHIEFKSDLSKEEHEMVVRRLKVLPNFPKKGLKFKDLSHVIGDPKVFRTVIGAFVKRYKDMNITAVAGIESRGFIFASPVALGLKVPFVPFRKPGKLACQSVGVDIKMKRQSHTVDSDQSTFGKDRLEMHEGGFKEGDRVLVIDDMLGSGSTLKGACDLAAVVGAEVVECAVVTELRGLGGRDALPEGKKIYILLEEVA
mmetsp:Transcript_12169/g.29448  ORF Transcript_12169/g.29448 Transcript_12169/m.29448 type:complete len:203 (+) Transcript_12169:83-691(+)